MKPTEVKFQVVTGSEDGSPTGGVFNVIEGVTFSHGSNLSITDYLLQQ